MAINSYTPASPAAGNPTNVYNLGKILKSIDVVEVLDRLVKTIPVPMNKNETVNMQRAVTPEQRLTEVLPNSSTDTTQAATLPRNEAGVRRSISRK